MQSAHNTKTGGEGELERAVENESRKSTLCVHYGEKVFQL